MKVFVCSRMNQLQQERKAAIDTLSAAGCQPLYFEQYLTGNSKQAKEKMDEMVTLADAMVVVCPRNTGRVRDLLGTTPTRYELTNFYSKLPKSKRKKRLFVFKDQKMSTTLEPFFDEHDIKPILYEDGIDLAGKIYDLGEELASESRDPSVAANDDGYVLRYSGPDFPGLLKCLSEALYKSEHRLNVSRISFASGVQVATLYIACSAFASSKERRKLDSDELEVSLNTALEGQITVAQEKGTLTREPSAFDRINGKSLITLTQEHIPRPNEQFYLEVRTIDRPGQLFAVSFVLDRLSYNIDELELRPAARRFRQQTVMIFWFSKSIVSEHVNINRDLAVLETALGGLVGVLTFSIRILDGPSS